MSEFRQNYVDGEWSDSEGGDTFESTNPADTGDVIGEYQRSTATDAERAVEAADAASEEWATTPGPERGGYLRRVAAELDSRRDELTETLVREEGKARPEAAGEVGRAVDIFYYYAEKARDRGGEVRQPSGRNKRLYTREEPIGVASVITPWNYPIAIPAWKIAPALAAGNAVVWKPATLTPEIATKLTECVDAADLPDGVLNLLTGSGSDLGEPLTTHDAVDAVSFTGSTDVGKRVYGDATDEEKRVQTEMGGKNPAVVCASADPSDAAEIVAAGGFGVTGQACTATSRAIVHESVHDEFVSALVEEAESIEIGPGLDGYGMGPQVDESELESTLEYVEIGEEEGGTIETGGGTPDGDRYEDGFFVEPTVVTDVDPDSTLGQEEVFGPVVAVMAVSDFDEAMAVANGVDYGLSASVISDSNEEIGRFVDEIEAGVVKVNEKSTGLDLHVPFGGFKDSSSETYREQGDAGYDFFSITKTVYHNY
ncbi:2,5-dioxovalerate dehydrogenase [Natronorarus salvus]|uniref:2,5-dioxovalerate dehydrogenase n=1 Tax=Natronorarus salvus TaxID=3117733 RepID=UPI002F26A674